MQATIGGDTPLGTVRLIGYQLQAAFGDQCASVVFQAGHTDIDGALAADGATRFQQQFVAGPAKTRAALGEVADDAMDVAGRTAVLPEGEGARLVEYLPEIDGVLVAGQLQVQAERLAERFFQFELDDIEREFPFADDEGEFQVPLTHGSFLVPGGRFLPHPLEKRAPRYSCSAAAESLGSVSISRSRLREIDTEPKTFGAG